MLIAKPVKLSTGQCVAGLALVFEGGEEDRSRGRQSFFGAPGGN